MVLSWLRLSFSSLRHGSACNTVHQNRDGPARAVNFPQISPTYLTDQPQVRLLLNFQSKFLNFLESLLKAKLDPMLRVKGRGRSTSPYLLPGYRTQLSKLLVPLLQQRFHHLYISPPVVSHHRPGFKLNTSLHKLRHSYGSRNSLFELQKAHLFTCKIEHLDSQAHAQGNIRGLACTAWGCMLNTS